MKPIRRDRRELLAGAAGAGLLLLSSGAGAAPKAATKGKADDVPPTEDLMREHGILRRVLLIYDEAARRLGTNDGTVISVVGAAANIVHRFVEGYHEKLEEEFVFPKLEKAGKLTDLTKVLRVQHLGGRKLTESIIGATKAGKAPTSEQRLALVADLQSFARMYAPHAAWEDTELFPVYREQFSETEFDKLGDRFEDQEHKLLGSGGFEGSLKDVGELEKILGIHDLAKFTPV
ncbi:MAG TPA: hemerythrin domain-containing protein [Polyangia bacterium]|jgi:hemerythrin-like domain-containing protein|nr:hemerythrin domain-containing protein [Polyangia bacterium]